MDYVRLSRNLYVHYVRLSTSNCDSNENSRKTIVPDDFHFLEKEIGS